MLAKNQTYPSVADFYAGKTVALTGGTGFLGQGIIEKLLYSCPEVKKIILLIRNKRGVSPEDRLKSLADKPSFDRVRKVHPNFMDKLSYVSCNLEAKDLGISRQSKRLLRNEVNVFIHCAATLKFNEIIRVAYEMNVQCTRRIMKILKRCRHLESFVHVSTAFVNSNNHCDVIEEKIYRRRINYKDVEKSLKFLNDKQLAGMLNELLDGLPNTYTLTKAWAEDAIVAECGPQIPVCIVRPGMITPALFEPQPGWITNVYGPTAFVSAILKGICKLANADRQINADLVPVDFVVNGCICAGMKTAVDARNERSKLGLNLGSSPMDEISSNSEGYSSHGSTSSEESGSSLLSESFTSESPESFVEKRKQVPCYHITICAQNPLPIQTMVNGMNIWSRKEPADMIIPNDCSVTYNKTLYKVRSFFKEYVPSFIIDIVARLSGQTPRAVMICKKLRAGMEVMEPFFMYCHDFQWKESKNMLMSLKEEDQKTFNFDPSSFSWEEYMRLYCRGARKFILREKTTDAQNKKKEFIVGTFFHCLGMTREVCVSAMTSSVGYTSCLWDNTSYYYR